MTISSTFFANNGVIPKKYTCDGENMNPELLIRNVPAEAKSLVLILDDPDAPFGTFTHWLVWNIDPKLERIPENATNIGVEGLTSFNKTGYGGPCPPHGKPHRYRFKLYALDAMLEVPPTAVSKTQIEMEIDKHVLEMAELVGRYER
jgi:Raf kinase inhibitor-like YbhB/YbcL family protein